MMRHFAFFCSAAILAGCTGSEDRAVEKGAARDSAASAARPSATISLSDVAGKWKLRSMDPDGSNPAEAVLNRYRRHFRLDLHWPKPETRSGPRRGRGGRQHRH